MMKIVTQKIELQNGPECTLKTTLVIPYVAAQ